jgi:acetyl-CoA carboxylase carboxyl transferase subunit alpha
MRLAEKFSMPIVTFIDTPGAYPGIQAEERGQSEAIATNLFSMLRLKVPIICVVIGEGCSGGALGIGVGDKILMLEYSYFSIISPEGCASILWKTTEKASSAAETMGITAYKLKNLGIVNGVILEPLGGSHRSINQVAQSIKIALINSLHDLLPLKNALRIKNRYKKIASIGTYQER